jgi:hypothetical protein
MVYTGNIMKTLIFPILFSVALSGCLDTTRDRRASFPDRNQQQTQPYQNTPTGGSIILPGSGSSEERDASEETAEQNPEVQIPAEISHCQWSTDGVNNFKYNHTHLGNFNICQSSQSEVDINIQIRSPITDAQLCILPTYHSGSSSIYIGEPRCFLASNPKTVYKVTLLKNRPNYGHLNVTGVMVMKDKAFFYPAPFHQYVLSPDAYLFCSQFLDMYQDSSYCNAFKNVGQYVYHQFGQ